MGENRDYYADLELPPTADVQEIKKQFRKLALKYHPDRNPGREQEVNAKFQIIQSAHEILADPTEKAKYDASFGGRTSRYPAPSGRKGNPWSEAAQNFPPPPRRNNAAPGKPAASTGGGAQRWSSRFAAGVPPTAKQYASADSESKKNAAKAFESMRKAQAKKPQAKTEPPPPPPRTQSARERAEASFGTRKTNPVPRPPMDESEPIHRKPVPQFYDVGSESRPPVPDPLSQFRDSGANSDARYNSQYATHGGEKLDPFEGLHRNPSSRDSGDDGQPRSRRDDTNNGSAGAYAKASFNQRSKHGSNTDNARTQTDPGSRPQTNPDSMYANSLRTTLHKISPYLSRSNPIISSSFYGSISSVYSPQPDNRCPSTPQESLQFEKQLQDMLSRLIDANDSDSSYPPTISHTLKKEPTDSIRDHSFNFKVDDDAFNNAESGNSPSRRHPEYQTNFDKSNVDGIDTKFSKESASSTWSFTAGASANEDSNPGSPSVQANTGGPTAEQPGYDAGFNPGGWTDKFGPQTFVPQKPPASTTSPTRASRQNSRKNKPVKSNANNPIVINDSDEEESYDWTGRKGQTQDQTTETPQAMDIDTPPAVPPRPPAAARTMYVEPTRPEWRSNAAPSTNEASATYATNLGASSAATVGGSEDSDEFKASFADLKNVAPFAQEKSGLKSFTELKDNLPFESKASNDAPLHVPKFQALVFPTPPMAPRLPPTVAIDGMTPNLASWNRYLDDFGMYLQEWELFNTQVVDHFATRNAHVKRIRESKGYAFLGSRSATEIQEYINWVQQDNDVRRRWNAACEAHEERFREFMVFRNKMKEETL